MRLEDYFAPYRANIIGIDQEFESPCGRQRILYADWMASGRMFRPIERMMSEEIAPFVGNTHTETSVTGTTMTSAYHKALHIIKDHVHASADDAIICYGSGMTSVVNKFQRILGLRVHEKYQDQVTLPDGERPIIFVSHMEHHSNQTSWMESVAEVHVISPTSNGLIDLADLSRLLDQCRHRTLKIAAITSCSNVTGIITPYHAIAGMMHRAGGLCFVDFAASAPYIAIDIHPANRREEYLDAVFFSPHKFLGGPGASGAMVFSKRLYSNRVPDNPGGGTVDWTNPWGGRKYHDDIEAREDGGTPGFTQAIRAALCIRLKEAMGVENILRREHELLELVWDPLVAVPGLHILADAHRDRLGIISFYIDGLHYNLAVRLLNDRYGIQLRGGCSCAGTYGHYLLHVTPEHSQSITDHINRGDKSEKPGWVRLSLHPTTTDEEARFLVDAISTLAQNYREWSRDYAYNPTTNEFSHRRETGGIARRVQHWFEEFRDTAVVSTSWQPMGPGYEI
jgi:selenocysteine lyase/cysteine desulfurase